jgi:BirA family biotin operon repressor/biotin-[acetyl-CoA-carboxylase] ligase
MLTEGLVREAVRAAGIEVPARFATVTGSTNADLLALAASGAPAWTVLATGHQRAGRGRLGRTWVERPGSSLLVSVLLRPGLAAERSPTVTLAAGLAVVRALADRGVPGPSCKWPNDVEVSGRKIAGILTEGAVEGDRLAHAVVGMGINVLQGPDDFPGDLREGATSLAIEGGRTDAAPLLTALLTALRGALEELAEDPGGLLAAYAARCSTIGRAVAALTMEGEPARGTATGIGPLGELLVETADGVRRVGFGEVRHLR